MPKELQHKIKKALLAAPRFHNGIYEKRALICGIKVEASSADIAVCEEKFLIVLTEKLDQIHAADTKTEGQECRTDKTSRSSTLFTEWTELWFTEIYKSGVIEYTYNREKKAFFRHAVPFFKDKRISDITPLDCVRFFNALKAKGIERTAESCYGHLNRIFAFALENGVIRKNPLDSMKPVKHKRVGGKPLTKKEETALLAAAENTPFKAAVLLGLYAGLRPCEIETARVEGNFIISENRKQKDHSRKYYKKIPITPMLKPYYSMLDSQLPLKKFSRCGYTKIIKSTLPNHRPYDLRDTFATRAQECGVLEQVVQQYMGHAPTTLLGRVYTKFSDEFLYEEGLKIKY